MNLMVAALLLIPQDPADEARRLRSERAHDLAEREALLKAHRNEDDAKSEKEPGATAAAGARFESGITRSFQGGVVLRTSAKNYLPWPGQTAWSRLGLEYDVESVTDAAGRELVLERCDRCSPGLLFVKETAGPIRSRVKGTQVWLSPYALEFPAPKEGDRAKVGDFTIEVAWPTLRVTSPGGWRREIMNRVGSGFTFEVKPGVGRKPFFGEGRYGGSFGGAHYSSSTWCSCKDGPKRPVGKPGPEVVKEVKVAHGELNFSLQEVTRILYAFSKPIEIPIDFTVDVNPK